MDHLKRLQSEITRYAFLLIFGINLGIIALLIVLIHYFYVDERLVSVTAIIIVLASSYFIAKAVTKYATIPIQTLWQAILHVAPEHLGTPAPNLEQTKVGRELVTSLALQVYQLGSSLQQKPTPVTEKISDQSQAVVNNLPIPVIVLDREQTIVYGNNALSESLQMPLDEIIGKNMYSVLDLSFPSDQTFDSWLTACRKDKLTATMNWERVRLGTKDQKMPKQFDMVAYYNKNNPSNVETIVGLYDQTSKYNQDDDAMGFIALAVHELRTPLTMLRGYIEVLEEELEGKLDDELSDYMRKMQASAQQLASFVSNILNVARVEENQLFLQLKEENWEDLLKNTLKEMSLRAQVHGKQIVLQVQHDLPTVAVDSITISEVINNLVDNAIKYSNKSQKIIVKTYMSKDGLIVTTVQDFGIGIPSNAIGNLFEKFYRSHRSRVHVGGTGLGLYLCKSILNAHGGQIWVQSKEGEGSTFGFSLVPYAKLAEELKKNDNSDITRTAHGWIKNHSFYRR